MEAESEVKASLVLAMQRTDLDLKDIVTTSNDILDEFSFLKLSDTNEALRLGSLGKYGKSFKLTTQEVCFWIREYIKEKNKNRML